MIFDQTPLGGAYLIGLEKRGDDRGFFARVFCEKEFGAKGLVTRFVQVNNSLSADRGTLRGMHYQRPPHEETKVVRCTRGAIHDVVVDLRSDSPTFARWAAAELSAANGRAVYVPRGCAHGFLTLVDDTDVEYVISTAHAPDAEAGVRFNDSAFAITWPFVPVIVSDRDRSYPLINLDDLRRR